MASASLASGPVEHPVVRAEAGPPLGVERLRTRPAGQIGGLAGIAPAGGALDRLAAALGPGAALLPDPLDSREAASARLIPAVADWDCCFVGDEPVRSLEQWLALALAGRLAEVQGAFVLAWRDAAGALHLARDAIGERTLYYALVPGGLIFASSIRALLATGLVPRALHLPALARYLSYAYVPGRETLCTGAFELLPGELLRFDGSLVRTRLWTVPDELVAPAEPDEAALRSRLRACLEAAVRRRLPAPGEPLGAFLSGGLDSSLVVALARQLHDGPLHTYSVSFGAGYANELPFSSLVAREVGTDHCIVELAPPVVLHHIDETIGLLHEPIGDPLTVPNALLFREAARRTGIVLNGEGGDPCFGGPKNLPMLLAELLGDGGAEAQPERFRRERSYLRAHQKCYDDLPQLLRPEVRAALADKPLETELGVWFEDPRFQRFVTRLMAMNVTLKGAHHILPKVDALGAAAGVLARSPLFDRQVVELAFEIPPQLKLRGSIEKYLLKQSIADLLPRAILERPKSGMLVPVEAWFQGPLRPHAQQRLLDGLASRALFERAYLERLLAGRLGGLRPRHGAKIWLLLTLEAWLRKVLQLP